MNAELLGEWIARIIFWGIGFAIAWWAIGKLTKKKIKKRKHRYKPSYDGGHTIYRTRKGTVKVRKTREGEW